MPHASSLPPRVVSPAPPPPRSGPAERGGLRRVPRVRLRGRGGAGRRGPGEAAGAAARSGVGRRRGAQGKGPAGAVPGQRLGQRRGRGHGGHLRHQARARGRTAPRAHLRCCIECEFVAVPGCKKTRASVRPVAVLCCAGSKRSSRPAAPGRRSPCGRRTRTRRRRRKRRGGGSGLRMGKPEGG